MQVVKYKLNGKNKRPLMKTIYSNLAGWLTGCKDLEVVIRPYKSKRTNEQNKRLWKIYQVLSEQVWVDGKQFSQDAWHEFLKRKFIGTEELPDGSVIGLSTRELDTQEAVIYQDKIQSWAASEFGVIWEF